MATIVVGVDGSKGSHDALLFAVEEARLRGARVRAVMASVVTSMAYDGMSGFGPDVDPRKLEDSARAALDAAVDAIGEQDDVEIERVLNVGHPAQVLIEEGRGAEMLVVGPRGHGGFVGLLLGSVSHECALHASCPVVIVHPPPTH